MKGVKVSRTYTTIDGKKFKNRDKAYLHRHTLRLNEFGEEHGADMLTWMLQHHEEAIEIGKALEDFINRM